MLGETGTGKEFVARVLHHNGGRASSPFIGVNCTAIPRDLFESELFGYERGAFTGAHQRKLGLLDRAEGGTLFLDEIGDLDLSMQAKLLRVIQERTFRRLGGTNDIAADFRSDRRDKSRSQKRHCRGRLSGRSLFPPERRRTGAAAAQTEDGRHSSADHEALLHYGKEFGKEVTEIDAEARALLERYHYPGNISGNCRTSSSAR